MHPVIRSRSLIRIEFCLLLTLTTDIKTGTKKRPLKIPNRVLKKKMTLSFLF